MTKPTPLPTKGNENEIENQAEQYIIDIFHQEPTQARLRNQMEQVVRSELGKMSELLREAIRDWVSKEKSKHDQQVDPQNIVLLEEKLDNFERSHRKLSDENKKLDRQVRLQEIENRMILEGLKNAQRNKKPK